MTTNDETLGDYIASHPVLGEHTHKFVDGGICEVCGSPMSMEQAYAWAEDLLEEARDTLDSAGASDPVNKHFTEMTNIAIEAALEQLREDKP